jgi:hypothetical protein
MQIAKLDDASTPDSFAAIATEDDDERGIQGGFHLDHIPNNIAGALYPPSDLYRDNLFSVRPGKHYPENFDGSFLMNVGKPAQIWDQPGWLGVNRGFHNFSMRFETVAICVDTGAILGAITWGFSVRNGVVSQLPLGTSDAASPTFNDARNRFHEQTGLIIPPGWT